MITPVHPTPGSATAPTGTHGQKGPPPTGPGARERFFSWGGGQILSVDMPSDCQILGGGTGISIPLRQNVGGQLPPPLAPPPAPAPLNRAHHQQGPIAAQPTGAHPGGGTRTRSARPMHHQQGTTTKRGPPPGARNQKGHTAKKGPPYTNWPTTKRGPPAP